MLLFRFERFRTFSNQALKSTDGHNLKLGCSFLGFQGPQHTLPPLKGSFQSSETIKSQEEKNTYYFICLVSALESSNFGADNIVTQLTLS